MVSIGPLTRFCGELRCRITRNEVICVCVCVCVFLFRFRSIRCFCFDFLKIGPRNSHVEEISPQFQKGKLTNKKYLPPFRWDRIKMVSSK